MSDGQRVELSAFSAFIQTPVYSVGGETVFGLMQEVIVPDATDARYTVPSEFAGRMDLISNYFYSTPLLWWAIASVNNMLDPMVEPPPGVIIRVPTRERLAKEGVLNV